MSVLFRATTDRTAKQPPLPAIVAARPRPCGPHRPGWRARDGNDALELPAAAEPRHPAGDECPQRGEPLLAWVAEAGVPLSRADHVVLRIR